MASVESPVKHRYLRKRGWDSSWNSHISSYLRRFALVVVIVWSSSLYTWNWLYSSYSMSLSISRHWSIVWLHFLWEIIVLYLCVLLHGHCRWEHLNVEETTMKKNYFELCGCFQQLAFHLPLGPHSYPFLIYLGWCDISVVLQMFLDCNTTKSTQCSQSWEIMGFQHTWNFHISPYGSTQNCSIFMILYHLI